MVEDKKKTLIVLIGPTGIGKTDLSIELAQHFQTEILSCDSRQMFRELKIGTAAPTQEQLAAVPHHFIGHLSIHDYYSAGRYENAVLELLPGLFETKDYALMTGGSGLYVDAVVKGIDNIPRVSDAIREKYMQLLQDKGLEHLQTLVQEIDPAYYAQADTQNAKRLLKALETYEMTGQPYSSLRTNQTKARDFNIVQIGLTMDREKLYERINLRVDLMLEAGLLEEARSYYPFKELNALNTVGYKELFGYFDGAYDLEEAIRLIKRNSRRYAKRQMSWFKRDSSILWFHPTQKEEIIATIGQRHVM